MSQTGYVLAISLRKYLRPAGCLVSTNSSSAREKVPSEWGVDASDRSGLRAEFVSTMKDVRVLLEDRIGLF